MITLIILTYNEELHLQRCLESVKNLAERIIIVDSFSTDKTCEIAQQFGAEVIQRKFVNQAEQFQWALENTNISTEWVFRLDADEYIFGYTIVNDISATQGRMRKNTARTSHLPVN